MRKSQKATLTGSPLDTLAQSGTTTTTIVNGLGVDLSNTDRVKSRAKRKHISQLIAIKLAEIAKARGNKQLEQKFWNTYHCLNKVNVAEGKMYGKYCKNRFCTVCSSIRKAEIINRYFDEIITWPEPHFVTLTCKTVPAKQLEKLIENVLHGFHKSVNKHKKRNQRGKGKKLMGIRSLECNFNPIARTYNPHFHLIVPDKETGDILVNEWLLRPLIKKSKTRWTHKVAQLNVKITNLEKCLIEVVKYSTKIFTEPDVKNKSTQQKERTLYIKSLYTIIEAMQGKRIFDRFGFDLTGKSSKQVFPATLVTDFTKYSYSMEKADWLDEVSELPLTNYTPDEWVRHILKHCINDSLS